MKNNKITKTAASDFMEIERQRGISVATSVMAFHYKDLLINLWTRLVTAISRRTPTGP